MPSKTGNRFAAVYSDGKTARAQDLIVVPQEQGLLLFDEQEQPFEVWAYDQLSSIDHLHPGQAAQLGHKENPGARLYVERGDFAAELIAHLPHMSRHAANRRVAIPLMVIGLVLAGILGGLWAYGISIPQAIAHMIPDKARKGLGNQVIASLSGGRTACTGEAGVKAFAKLVDRISKGAGQSGKFDIQVMPLGMMNAFAAPGERIVVSQKLIDFVKSPEELAGVIAHEMGHGIKRHPEAGIVRALGISAAINIAFGGATGGFGDVGAMLLQLKYSRSAEFEADAMALDILKAAEIPAKPFASFFTRLDEKRGARGRKKSAKNKEAGNKNATRQSGLSQTLKLLSTHPASPERIAIIESQPEWKTRILLSEVEWKALRNICDDDQSASR